MPAVRKLMADFRAPYVPTCRDSPAARSAISPTTPRIGSNRCRRHAGHIEGPAAVSDLARSCSSTRTQVRLRPGTVCCLIANARITADDDLEALTISFAVRARSVLEAELGAACTARQARTVR